MKDLHRRVAAYLRTELTGEAGEKEIMRQSARVNQEIVRLDGAKRVVTFTDTGFVEGPLPSGLTELLEAAMRFDFDTVVAEYLDPFLDDGFVEKRLRDCHVATRGVGHIEIDDEVISIARAAMPFMRIWGWREERHRMIVEAERDRRG